MDTIELTREKFMSKGGSVFETSAKHWSDFCHANSITALSQNVCILHSSANVTKYVFMDRDCFSVITKCVPCL